MTTENSAVVKIVAQKTKEYNDLDTRYKKLGVKVLSLIDKHKTLMEVHMKTVTALRVLTGKYEEQRREIVEGLNACIETKKYGEFGNEWVINLGMFKHQVKKWEGKK